METLQTLLFFKPILSPYPTYEEWKQNCNILDIYCSDSPYPTYEEWKPGILLALFVNPLSPYPTYEEWKPNFMF